jgi:hypothetical protein
LISFNNGNTEEKTLRKQKFKPKTIFMPRIGNDNLLNSKNQILNALTHQEGHIFFNQLTQKTNLFKP